MGQHACVRDVSRCDSLGLLVLPLPFRRRRGLGECVGGAPGFFRLAALFAFEGQHVLLRGASPELGGHVLRLFVSRGALRARRVL